MQNVQRKLNVNSSEYARSRCARKPRINVYVWCGACAQIGAGSVVACVGEAVKQNVTRGAVTQTNFFFVANQRNKSNLHRKQMCAGTVYRKIRERGGGVLNAVTGPRNARWKFAGVTCV